MAIWETILWEIVCLPMAPVAVGLGVGQVFFARRRLPLPFLLPALTGSVTLYCAYQMHQAGNEMKGYAAASRLAELFWSVPLAWAGLAFLGVLVGWVTGYLLERKRKGRPPDV